MVASDQPRMSSVDEVLRDEFDALSCARQDLPLLSDWGIEDFSETVHSAGINYLAAIGRRAKRVAVTEYPVRITAPSRWCTPVPGWVIPDAVWWDRETREVELIAEFERYEPGASKRQTLQEKARNLLLAHREIGSADTLLLLVVWTLSGIPVRGLDEIRLLVRSGFRDLGGIMVPGLPSGSTLLIATAVFCKYEGLLRLREVLV
jgi:hypothetical protein